LSAIATLTSTVTIALASIAVAAVTSVAIGRSSIVAISVTEVAAWRWAFLKCLVIRLYLVEKFVAELFGASYTLRARSCNVKVHGFIALLA
jgi:hypothetical protein